MESFVLSTKNRHSKIRKYRKLTRRFPILSKNREISVQVSEFEVSTGRKKVITIVMPTMVFFRLRPSFYFQ